MNARIPSKPDILFAFFQLQQQASKLLFSGEGYKNKGDLGAALVAYEQLIVTLQQQLELAELNNQHYPDSPFDILPIVHPLLNAMLVQADVFEALGDLEKAEKAREEAMRISEKYLSQVDIAERERQRAASLISQGRFNEALVALTAARDIFQERSDPLNMASVTANIAGILEWLGDYDRALMEVKRVSQFIEPLTSGMKPSQSEIAASLFSGKLQEAEERAKLLRISLEIDQIQARINRYLGNFAEAELQFRRIMSQMPGVGQLGIEFQLAAILICDSRYEEGLEYLKRLEPKFRGLLRPKWGVLLSYRAEALLGLGQPDQALTNLDAAIQDLSNYLDPDSLWKNEWRRARALDALDRPAEALAAYAQTADTINGLRKAPLGYRLDSTYLRDKLPVFEAAIDLACKRGEAETCCRFMEMIKSRILTSTLSISASDQPKSASDLDRQVDELSRQIDALEYAAYRDGWTEGLDQKRASLLSARADLMEQIRFSDPRWRSLSEPVSFDLRKTLDLLEKRQQAALTLFYQPHQVIGVLLMDGKCTVAKVQISAETSTALANYQQNLQSTKPKPGWFDPSSGLKLDAEHLISAELLKPALQAKSLVIVPHGPLHLLPWAGLTFKGKRLFEYCPVGIVPNLSCLRGLQTDFSTTPHVGLIGAPDYSSLPKLEPLYLAQEELLTIQEAYPSHRGVIGDAFMNKEAKEANFWQLAKHEKSAGNILHIACHGTFVTGDPLNSGLLFTDSKIDAAEIARTRLWYNEIILSACSTGYRPTEVQGVALSGDDIVGLPGAFLEAGARSVLVSIPKARGDVTLQFMTIYHENRAEGKSPMFALQATQEIMSSSPVYEPYLWIGFTVYGCQ